MSWSKEAPQLPGYYWAIFMGRSTPSVVKYLIEYEEILVPGDERPMDVEDFEWWGPKIEVPIWPKL